MKLIPVEPIRHEEHAAHFHMADGSGKWGTVNTPIYPESEDGKRFAAARRSKGVTLRDAAARLELRPSELSGLERGSLTLEPRDWLELMKVIECW